MDILFFAAIAGFILFRLYSVLGKDVGLQRGQVQTVEQVSDVKLKEPTATVTNQIDELKKLAPQFDPNHFVNGASQAFAMILEALNKGDKDTLKKMLSPNLYRIFEQVIATREKNGEVWDNHLLRVQSTEIQEIDIQNNTDAFVTVKFVSEQILVTNDSKGNLLEGDPNQIEVISDLWTFTKNMLDEDPNWLLSSTAEVDEQNG